MQFANVKFILLPPNTTLLIQPMDQGIIVSFKQHYKSLVLHHLMTVMETMGENERATELAHKLMLVDSLHMQKKVWSCVTQVPSLNVSDMPTLIRR